MKKKRVFLIVILSAIWSASLGAQTHVVVTESSATSIDLDSGRINWQMSGHVDDSLGRLTLREQMAVTADGRWAAWLAVDLFFRPAWLRRDLVTGETTSIPVPASYYDLVAHPRRLQLFATQLLRGTVLIVEPSRNREVRTCARPADAAITLDGAFLFVACQSGEIVVLETARALVVGRIQARQVALRNIEVNADGSRLFVLGYGGPGGVSLDVYDWRTLALLASLPVPATPPCCPFVHEFFLKANADRTEIYAGFGFHASGVPHGETWVYASHSLHVVATLPHYFIAAAFTPDGRYRGGNGWSRLAKSVCPVPYRCTDAFHPQHTRSTRRV